MFVPTEAADGDTEETSAENSGERHGAEGSERHCGNTQGGDQRTSARRFFSFYEFD